MTQQPTLHKPTVAEMAAGLDQLADLQEATEGFAERIHSEVLAGNGTGSALVDLVIRRSGLYVSEQVRPYVPVEGLLAQNVGGLALVMTTIKNEREDWYKNQETRRPSQRFLAAGIINIPELIIDHKKGTWKIPTEKYACLKSDGSEVTVIDGPMPVRDILKKPAKPTHKSTLGNLLAAKEVLILGPGPPGEGYPSTVDQYTPFQTTTLWIGGTKIGKPGNKAVFRPLLKALKV